MAPNFSDVILEAPDGGAGPPGGYAGVGCGLEEALAARGQSARAEGRRQRRPHPPCTLTEITNGAAGAGLS